MSTPEEPAAQRVRKRSVRIAGHRTSVSLEDAFWDELARIAETRNLSLNALIAKIDSARGGNLSSAVRVFILNELRGRVDGAKPG
jgi:predicted DNA-binding ribbon-helix-helix protein